MIRVIVYTGKSKQKKTAIETKYYSDAAEAEARTWAYNMVQEGADRFAALWVCDDEESVSQHFLSIIQ